MKYFTDATSSHSHKISNSVLTLATRRHMDFESLNDSYRIRPHRSLLCFIPPASQTVKFKMFIHYIQEPLMSNLNLTASWFSESHHIPVMKFSCISQVFICVQQCINTYQLYLLKKYNNKYLQFLTQIWLLHINHVDKIQIPGLHNSTFQHYCNVQMVRSNFF